MHLSGPERSFSLWRWLCWHWMQISASPERSTTKFSARKQIIENFRKSCIFHAYFLARRLHFLIIYINIVHNIMASATNLIKAYKKANKVIMLIPLKSLQLLDKGSRARHRHCHRSLIYAIPLLQDINMWYEFAKTIMACRLAYYCKLWDYKKAEVQAWKRS